MEQSTRQACGANSYHEYHPPALNTTLHFNPSAWPDPPEWDVWPMFSSPLQEQFSQTLLTSCESAPQPQTRNSASAATDEAANLPAIEGTRKNSRWTEQQTITLTAS